ncbi:hypothetical protein [Microbacterium sp. BK668]|uniref:hypothetical protein n=1 Tax=Microbacterium sp. BK668 TaxID=2512118 RepID=UPI00105B2585|nr:hypothetical protein [Microbacterium sp. BK668]TDN91666.1 hypothetical protein EV279_1169 [Microbacterium sp. BK668]
MPFRSQLTLESWLTEFQEQGHRIDGTFKVMHQDGEDGANTGLVGVQLANASTVMYIQPEAAFATRWVVTMEARDEAITLDSDGVRALSDELATVSALCEFLETKSAGYSGLDTP